jgi:hypothetical protein
MREAAGLVALGGGLPSSTACAFSFPLASWVPSSSWIGRRLSVDRECARVFCSRMASVFAGDLNEEGKTSSSTVSPRGRFCSAERVRLRRLIPWRCRSRRFYGIFLATQLVSYIRHSFLHRDTTMAAPFSQRGHEHLSCRLEEPYCHECALLGILR